MNINQLNCPHIYELFNFRKTSHVRQDTRNFHQAIRKGTNHHQDSHSIN